MNFWLFLLAIFITSCDGKSNSQQRSSSPSPSRNSRVYNPTPAPNRRSSSSPTRRPATPKPTVTHVSTNRLSPTRPGPTQRPYTPSQPRLPTLSPNWHSRPTLPPSWQTTARPPVQIWTARPERFTTRRPTQNWATRRPHPTASPYNRNDYPYQTRRTGDQSINNGPYQTGMISNQSTNRNQWLVGGSSSGTQGDEKKSKRKIIFEKLKTLLKNPSTQQTLVGLLKKAFSKKKIDSNQRTPIVYGSNNRRYSINDRYQPQNNINFGENSNNEDSFSYGGDSATVLPGTINCVYDVPLDQPSINNTRIRQIIFECNESEICCGLDCCKSDFDHLNSIIDSALAESNANLSTAERRNLTETLVDALERRANFSDSIVLGNWTFNFTDLFDLAEEKEYPQLPVSIDFMDTQNDLVGDTDNADK